MAFDPHTLNPYIRVAFQSVLPAGTEIRRRIIFDYELIYLERGAFTLTYNDIDFPCTAGQFLFLRPGIPHSFHGITSDISQPHIHFDFLYTRKSPEIPVSFKDFCDLSPEERSLIQTDLLAQYPAVPFVNFSEPDSALNLFFMLTSKALASTLEQKAVLIQLINLLINDNFPDFFSKEEPRHNIARQLKDYIDAGQGLSAQLEDLEKQFSYSKYYLERQFQKYYGISLIAYRNNKRLELAKQLLAQQSVSAVAEELGFSSIYVFSRAFKLHFGISPSAIPSKE